MSIPLQSIKEGFHLATLKWHRMAYNIDCAILIGE